jgi:serine/threonine protein kinase
MQPFPPTMSTECRALIRGLLCTNPQQRTSLHELAHSPWLQSQALAYAKQARWELCLGRRVHTDLDVCMSLKLLVKAFLVNKIQELQLMQGGNCMLWQLHFKGQAKP